MSERVISNSSASQTKAEIFAQGAADTIIGDLQQEIVDGSTAYPTATGSVTNTIYIPKAPANAVPALVGSTGTNGLQNLVKRSASGQPFYTGGSTRASSVSTTSPSQNGRSISLARWNKPLLMPPTSASNLAPLASAGFTAPDWILVGRDGSNPTAVTAIPTDPNYVVGRYAYAIYDEGGLLDANVAGYPSTANATQTAYKSALFHADFAQVGLTSMQTDKLVAWRNWASAQVSGTSISTNATFTITPASVTNYFKSGLSNSTGFLRTSGAALYNGQSDRMFSSRQQLLSFLRNGIGVPTTNQAFQCLTHFSRALEQPSFIPDPNRPRIVSTSSLYSGNDESINLTSGGLLSIRVTGNFTRWNGTNASVGEPLVKTKFALSNLTRVSSNATASQSSNDPIYSRFGLYRSSASSPWIYNHGSSTAILTLSQVAAQNREPDFAELLKAAIHAGSVGKEMGSGGSNNFNSAWQMDYDQSGDIQILQIMANLIDQTKTDNYATWIQINDVKRNSGTVGQAILRNIYGTQDLPYIYSYHLYGLTTQAPNPTLNKDTVLKIHHIDPTSPPSPPVFVDDFLYRARATNNSIISSNATVMVIPEIWNPHDAQTPVAPNGGPTSLRIVVLSGPPTTYGNATYSTGNYSTPSAYDGSTIAGLSSLDAPASSLAIQGYTLSPGSANGTLQISFGSAASLNQAFREPTLVWRNGIPSGMTLSGPSRTESATLTGKTYFGFPVTDFHVAWTVPMGNLTSSLNTAYGTGNWTISEPGTLAGNATTWQFVGNSTTSSATFVALRNLSYYEASAATNSWTAGTWQGHLTFRMDYEYPTGSGNWIPYQEVVCEDTDWVMGYRHALWVDPGDFGAGGYTSPFLPGISNATISNATGSAAPSTLSTGGAPGKSPLSPPLTYLYDPRTSRFCAPVTGSYDSWLSDNWSDYGSLTLDAIMDIPGNRTTTSCNPYISATNYLTLNATNFVLMQTQRPNMSRGQCFMWVHPGVSSSNLFYTTGIGWQFPGGLFSQNNPNLNYDNGSAYTFYYEDPDGICRRAMGGYVSTNATFTAGTRRSNTSSLTGLPLATSGNATNNGLTLSDGRITQTSQSRSRPILLHRPFRSVAEMSYAFRGSPWKNIDFFMPESGDSALLDVFCVNEAPPDALVAGKVNLNTRNTNVLKALFQGAYIDEWEPRGITYTGNTTASISSITGNESLNLATSLQTITQDTTAAWRGPLRNISEIVGKFVPGLTATAAADLYQYTRPSGGTYSFAGFSAMTGNSTIWEPDSSRIFKTNIQRFREAAIRPLAACGQVRVWNLLIDVVAQTGRYPQSASGLSNFVVEGEKRYWVHVAIDRFTGQVIDRQIELVSE